MSRVVTLVGYALIGLAALALQLAARRSHKLPTFGQLMEVATRRWLPRGFLLAGWLWLGWHLFVRVDWR